VNKRPRSSNVCATAVRVAQLLARIRGRRAIHSLPALAAEVELNERTVRRYLEAFEDAGLDVPAWRKFGANA
jgi:predicted DNA-binding transcriptional regulator YafY